AAGQGAIVWLAGDAGVGKSRLLYEFLRTLDGTGAVEVETTCVSHGRAIPYYPILGLVRDSLGLADDPTADTIRRAVDERLTALGLPGDERAVLLAHFLGASAPRDVLERLTGEQLKARTLAVLCDLVLRGSARAPLVVIVENLHWIDASSEEFLAQLV